MASVRGVTVPEGRCPKVKSTEGQIDEIADRIIKAFTIKPEERFVNSNDDTISYQESEIRLIILGSVLGIVLNLVLSALLVLTNSTFSDTIVLPIHPPPLKHNILIPYLFIMPKLGLGDIIVLRQNKELTFDLDWSFKVPPNKVSNIEIDQFQLGSELEVRYSTTIETGFSVFEDRGNLFIVYSDTSKKMTVLHSSNKHSTLRNSQLPKPHLYHHSIVRTGNFVWIFGGYTASEALDIDKDKFTFKSEKFLNHGCSSVKYGAETGSNVDSAMWHIKKQRWFKGPSLPIKTCSLESSAVSLNQTDVLLFIGPFFNNYIVEGNGGQDWVNGKGGCIKVLHFSYSTFSWISQDDCFIDFGQRYVQNWTYPCSAVPTLSNILSLSATSTLDKDGKL